jgi:hypothetical protein
MPTIPSYPVQFTAPGQPAMTTETQCGPYLRSYPLEESEPTALVVTAEFMQARDSYTHPAVNSTLTYFGSTLYFIGDTGFREAGCGQMKWTRSWASIPATWSDWEEYPFTYPAFTASTVGASSSVTAIVASGGNFVLSTAGTGIVVNDIVFVNVSFTRNGLPYQYAMSTKCLATGSGTITIGPLFYGTGLFTVVSGSVTELALGRTSPLSMVVGSRLAYDYALSSTSSLRTDLPILAPWQPVDASGNVVDSLGASTAPTATTYRGLITDGGELIASASAIRRYMGNIYCRITRYVPAL